MFNMPLFTKKPPKTTSPTQLDNNNLKNASSNGMTTPTTILSATTPFEKKVSLPPPPSSPQIEPTLLKPQLVFHCQLAHGSPTGLITGFSSVKELYQKIAECYDFSVDEVSTLHAFCSFSVLYLSSFVVRVDVCVGRRPGNSCYYVWAWAAHSSSFF